MVRFGSEAVIAAYFIWAAATGQKQSFGFCLDKSIQERCKTFGEMTPICLIVKLQFFIFAQEVRHESLLARPEIIVQHTFAMEKETILPCPQ